MILELAGVTKTYGEVPVLRGVDLEVDEGELVAIVGPSGSGKSTLLHVMGTLERPSGGQVRIRGVDVAGLSDERLADVRARDIGFVFQQFFLSAHATAAENVADGMLYAGVDARTRRRRAAEALERVGLSHRAGFRPAKLSGGERQRVAIARALVNGPGLVLADEPTGALDAANGAAVLDLLTELHRAGTTIALITHDRDVAARVPRQVRILDGRLESDRGESGRGESGRGESGRGESGRDGSGGEGFGGEGSGR
jgi:putative ABC transport system ATP-binding protein